MKPWLFAAALGAAAISGCEDAGTTFTFDAAADSSSSDAGVKSVGGDAGGSDKPAASDAGVDAPADAGGS